MNRTIKVAFDIEKHPELYPDLKTLEDICDYLEGVSDGIYFSEGVHERLNYFSRFASMKYNNTSGMSWQHFAKFFSRDENELIKTFFELLHQFVEEYNSDEERAMKEFFALQDKKMGKKDESEDEENE